MAHKDEGIDLLRQMKEMRPRTPIIMLTAYDYRDDFAIWCADAYIVKSSDLTELKSTIKKTITDRRQECLSLRNHKHKKMPSVNLKMHKRKMDSA